VCVSPDGDCVVSGGDDRIVRMWRISTQECFATLTGHSDEVNAVGGKHGCTCVCVCVCPFRQSQCGGWQAWMYVCVSVCVPTYSFIFACMHWPLSVELHHSDGMGVGEGVCASAGVGGGVGVARSRCGCKGRNGTVCVPVRLFLHACVCELLWQPNSMSTCVCTCHLITHSHTHTLTHSLTHMHTLTHSHTNTHTHTHAHTHTHL